MKTDKTIRAFIAIALPQDIKSYLKQLQVRLRQYDIRASWPTPEALHLTLKFLGDVHKGKLPGIIKCLDHAASDLSGSLNLRAAALGVFPSAKKAGVLWSKVQGDTRILAQLVEKLDNELYRQFQIPVEKRRFSPHLTLARIKRPLDPKKTISILREFSTSKSNPYHATRITLFQSRLKATGAIHTPIHSVSIKPDENRSNRRSPQ